MIPSKKELAALVSLTVGCTLIVGLSPQRDLALMFCGGPLTLVAALIGNRRNQVRCVAALAARESASMNSES